MIVHLFNSNTPNGPEKLVLPALAQWGKPVTIGVLSESRLARGGETADYARSFGLPVFAVPVRSRWDRRAIAMLEVELAERHPAVVHAHDVKASFYLLKARGDFARISTHHGVLGRPGVRAKLYERFYSRFCLPRFDRTLCVSESDGSLLRRRGLRPIVHRNGIDRRPVPASEREQIRRRWNIPLNADTRLLGIVARISGEKRHDLMLRAFARARKNRDWRLLCFGVGPLEESSRRLAAELGIAEYVYWLGYRPEAASEMAGLDAVLCLSDNEGLPINLLEAGWQATPVIATAVGGIPELVDNSNGILVPRGDVEKAASAIESLLTDEARRREMGAALQSRVARDFSAQRWLARLEEVYSPWMAVGGNT